MKAFISGSGMCVPERVVGNEEIAGALGVTAERIYRATGIRRRRWAKTGTRTSTLASEALRMALTDAQFAARELDYLILGTMTPDRFIPGSAVAIQDELGLAAIPALDIRNSSCNALYGLQLAHALVASGTAHRIALCCADVQSPWLDLSPAAANTSMLFGDGAAALIVCGGEHHGAAAIQIVDVLLQSNGSHVDALGIRAPGSEYGPFPRLAHCDDFRPRMQGNTVLMRASRSMATACRALLQKHGLAAHDVRWIVPHQANINVMNQLLRALGMLRHADRMISVMEEYGNTSSASLGIALDVLRRSGQMKKGDWILMPAFGAGFTWGAALGLAVTR